MPKIYITNLSNVDYTQLEKEFGTPIVLSTGYVELSHQGSLKKFYDRVRGIIESASPEDYLVISGSSPVSIVLTHFWLKIHGIVKLMTYNRRVNGGTYTEVILTDTQISQNDSSN